MTSIAIEIVAILEKYGGWQLGPPAFKGEVHFASTDNRILARIPEDVRGSTASPLWIDRSQGDREIETNDPDVASALFDIPGALNNYRAKYEEMKKRCEEQKAEIRQIKKDFSELASIVEHSIDVNDSIIGLLKTICQDGSSIGQLNVTIAEDGISNHRYPGAYR